MEYKKILVELFAYFPDLQDEYDQNEYIQDLPHCVFDMIFVSAIKLYISKSENGRLWKVGEFLELMASSSDIQVKELLNVSVLEPLVLDGKALIQSVSPYLGIETLQNLSYWEERYS